MTSDKKRILLQIGVFLLISFGLMYAFGWKTYAVILGGGKVSGWYNLCYYIAAFSPAIGCIAVRYIFHEGFKDDILFPKFTGHFRQYLLSVILPLMYGVMNCIIITITLGAGFTIKAEGGLLEVVAVTAIYSAKIYFACFILIGEEFGWRAFLYDKLENLLGLNGSIVIGGIIWGLWHVPALVGAGINFGKDAPGFPVTNILLMCVMCIGFGVVLQLLRKMTDSVVAPIIAHAVIDTVCNPLSVIFLSNELMEGKSFQTGCCMVASSLIIGIPCWVIINKIYGIHNAD